MKVKECPKCGNKSLGEHWCKGRMLQQVCGAYGEESCGWKGEPYTPPKRRITNKVELRVDDFFGWHFQTFDKYGHVCTDSATYDTREEAMEEMIDDITPKEGYDDPAAPYTAVLVKVPSHVTVRGTMYRLKDGKVKKV